MWITDKEQKQSQVVFASSWPVAHRYPLELTHATEVGSSPWCSWQLCYRWQNTVKTNWAPLFLHSWTNPGSQPAHTPPAFQPPKLLGCFRLASHKCVALVSITFFWNVRLESSRKPISLINAKLWKWLVCSCAALMKPSPCSTSTMSPKQMYINGVISPM